MTVAATPRVRRGSGSVPAVTTSSASTGGTDWARSGKGTRRTKAARVRRNRGKRDGNIGTLRVDGRAFPSEGRGRRPGCARSAAHPSRAPEKARRMQCPRAGLLAPGSSAIGPLPGDATGRRPISRLQWDRVRRVPGHSGGGRAGISPASLLAARGGWSPGGRGNPRTI